MGRSNGHFSYVCENEELNMDGGINYDLPIPCLCSLLVLITK